MYQVVAKMDAKAKERISSFRQMTLWKPESGGGESGGGGASPWGTGIARFFFVAFCYRN